LPSREEECYLCDIGIFLTPTLKSALDSGTGFIDASQNGATRKAGKYLEIAREGTAQGCCSLRELQSGLSLSSIHLEA
jgi:hypothetical protein